MYSCYRPQSDVDRPHQQNGIYGRVWGNMSNVSHRSKKDYKQNGWEKVRHNERQILLQIAFFIAN